MLRTTRPDAIAAVGGVALSLLLATNALSCSSESETSAAGPGDAAPDVRSDATTNDAATNDAIDDVAADARGFHAGPKRLLSLENPDHKDEDPSVILAKDGSLVVAWFSQRNANPDIYLKQTYDGETWNEARVTSDAGGDFFPSLFQDDNGRFHLTWFRWVAFQVGSIWYNSSDDVLNWDSNTEVQVTTTPDVDDWQPSISQNAAGDLLIYFVSQKRDPQNLSRIFLARRPNGQAGFDAALALPELAAPNSHESLPFAARTGARLDMVFNRSDASEPLPWMNNSSDLYHSTSNDGVSWAAPSAVTSDNPDNVVDVFPALYPDLASDWSLCWVSTRSGAVSVIDLSLSELANSGAAKPLTAIEGYSPHIAPTPTPGVYLGVWVANEGSDPEKLDVFYRFFEK